MSKKLLMIVMAVLLILSWVKVFNGVFGESSEISSIKAYIKENEEKALYKNVVKGYQKLLDHEPTAKNYHELSLSYKNLNDMDAYKESLENEISIYPNQVQAYCDLMTLYQSKKDNRSVIDLYRKMPEKLRADSDILNIYQKSKYSYGYLTSSYQTLTSMIEGNCISYNGLAYGILNASGKTIIEPKLESLNIFANGATGGKLDGKWYFVDTDGDKIATSDDHFSYIGALGSNGYAPATLEEQAGYIDFQMKKYKFEYDYTGNFSNGIAAVKQKDKWALINDELKLITDFEFDDIKLDEGFCALNGFIFAKKGENFILLNTDGKQVGDQNFEDAKQFASSQPAAVKQNGRWGFINTEGQIVIECEYEDANSFSIGLAPVKIGNVYHYINEKGESLIQTQFNEAKPFNENGIAIVKNGDMYRMIQLYEYQKN